MKIFKKQKYIETRYKPVHIVKLKAEGMPYKIRERRIITTAFKKLYLVYSIILDCFVLGGIVWAIFNLDKLV